MAENENLATTDKKVEKVEKKKSSKPSVFSRIAAWFRSCKSEIKKIVWATPKSTLNNFVLVAVSVVVLSAAIGLVDYIFGLAINALLLIF